MAEISEQYTDLTSFDFNGVTYDVRQTGSELVADGVMCDTYDVPDAEGAWDLGIIRIEPWRDTPRQLVLEGDRTSEVYLAGVGCLLLASHVEAPLEALYYPDRMTYVAEQQHKVEPTPTPVRVGWGEIMQWRAQAAGLVVAELCWPPYKPGRFQNL